MGTLLQRLLLVCGAILTLAVVCCWSEAGSPLVIVPGILGNQIEGRLNKTTVPHYWCTKHTEDFITLWLAVTDLLPDGEVGCLSDNLRLSYDPITGEYGTAPGVETRIPGFGHTSSIEYLDPNTKFLSTTNYFHDMVRHFVNKGYVRGKNIVGAPYDWRYCPTQYSKQGYYQDLKKLIEDTYSNNGHQRVVLIAHSMGAPNTLYFLTKVVDQKWKDTYLRDYITLSGIWRGCSKSVKALASGDNEGIWIVPNSEERPGSRTYPSNSWLLPYPSDTWPQSEEIVFTPERNYSAWDYKELFNDMNFTRGYEMFLETENLTGPLPPPNVTLHCLYGSKMDTPYQFQYGPGEFPDTQPRTIYGDGDGTVNINSLMACSLWQGKQAYNVTLRAYPGVEHVHTIKNPDVITHVDSIVYFTKPPR